MRATATAVLLLALSFPAAAEDVPEGYTRLLVPLTAFQVSGANGSVWTTEWTAFNANPANVYVSGPFPFVTLSPPSQNNLLEPGETQRLVLDDAPGGMDGAWVYVATEELKKLTMSLRVRDTSVNAQSYGTNIPLVPDSEFAPVIRLIDVPTDPAYRITLRIYSKNDEPHPVIVRIYAPDRAAPVEEYETPLFRHEEHGFEFSPQPAFALLDPLSPAVRASGATKVRIEVTTKDAPVWSFASISHNTTQQVTTILP